MKEKKENRLTGRFNVNDIMVAMLIILFSFLPFAVKLNAGVSDNKALIYKEGKVISEISLEKDQKTVIGPLAIEVKDNKIRVADADCPNHICVHSGFISEPGQSVVCLPNKMLIEIPASSKNTGYDSVAW